MTLLFRNPVHDDHPYFFDPKPFASYQLYQLGELICPRGYLLEELDLLKFRLEEENYLLFSVI